MNKTMKMRMLANNGNLSSTDYDRPTQDGAIRPRTMHGNMPGDGYGYEPMEIREAVRRGGNPQPDRYGDRYNRKQQHDGANRTRSPRAAAAAPYSDPYRRRMIGEYDDDDDDDDMEDYRPRRDRREMTGVMPYRPPKRRRDDDDDDDDDDEEDGYKKRKPRGIRAGGTFWMDAPEPGPLTQEKAERWVKSMHNEDPAKPTGGKWTLEEVKAVAKKNNIQLEEDEIYPFYAMMNAMYSDYSEVGKKFGITTPDFYACLTKAWMADKDAVKDKTAVYYDMIVKK